MKKTLLIIVCIALHLTLNAASGISFSAMPINEGSPLDDANAQRLNVKIEQIIAYNNVGARTSMSQLFVIQPEFVVTSSDMVNTGMRNLYVVRGELTLFSRNLIDGNTFSTVVLSLEGSGKSEQDSYRVMINSVRNNNPQVVKFVKESAQRVEEYYERILPQVLTKANMLVSGLNFEEALAVLSVIPECVEGYTTVSELMTTTFIKMLDRDATLLMNQAKSHMAKKEYNEVIDVLGGVDPLSTHYKASWEMILNAVSKIEAAERQAAEEKIAALKAAQAREDSIRHDKMELEKLKLENQDKQHQREMELEKLNFENKDKQHQREIELEKMKITAERAKEFGDNKVSETAKEGFKEWFSKNFLK